VDGADRSQDGSSGNRSVSVGSSSPSARHRENWNSGFDPEKEGKLTDEEKALMNKHPEYSWSILRLFAGLDKASLYALHHHESYDGSGYPGGLKGTEIPIGSRIVSVIDAYDAMISIVAIVKEWRIRTRCSGCFRAVARSLIRE